MKLIEAWKTQVVQARRNGWSEDTCAASAKVSMAKLKEELARDPDFKARYEEASANAGKPPRF